ncbi:MAG: type II CAAX endopeptidase family protein [Candidatus Caldarchaeum sp.]
MIRQDGVSIALTVVAASQLIFLGTFGTQIVTVTVFILAIMMVGLVLSMWLGYSERDESIDSEEREQLLVWSIVALATIGALNLLNLFKPAAGTILSIALGNVAAEARALVSRMLGVLIAVAEEQFFRGALTNMFIRTVGQAASMVLSGIIFAVYHLAVYGSQPTTMLIIAGAGTILAFTAIRTGRVSTPMIAHVVNNVLAGI